MILFYRQGNWDTGKLGKLSKSQSWQSQILNPGSLAPQSTPSSSTPSLGWNMGGQHSEWADISEAPSADTGNSRCSINDHFNWMISLNILWFILSFLFSGQPGEHGEGGITAELGHCSGQVTNQPSHRVVPFIFKHTHTSSDWWQARVVVSVLWFGIQLI